MFQDLIGEDEAQDLLASVSYVSADDDLELLQTDQKRAVFGLHNALFALDSQFSCSYLPLSNIALEVDRCHRMVEMASRNHEVKIAVAKGVGHAALRDLGDLIKRHKVGIQRGF